MATMGRYTGENIEKDDKRCGKPWVFPWEIPRKMIMAFPYRAVSLQDCKPQA